MYSNSNPVSISKLIMFAINPRRKIPPIIGGDEAILTIFAHEFQRGFLSRVLRRFWVNFRNFCNR
jgi:hypothetical protein